MYVGVACFKVVLFTLFGYVAWAGLVIGLKLCGYLDRSRHCRSCCR